MAMGIIVASILIVIFTIKKYKKCKSAIRATVIYLELYIYQTLSSKVIVTTPAAHPEDGSTPNEYIQTLCVTQ